MSIVQQKKRKKAIFNVCTPHQAYLFPPSAEDFIPWHHPAHMIYRII